VLIAGVRKFELKDLNQYLIDKIGSVLSRSYNQDVDGWIDFKESNIIRTISIRALLFLLIEGRGGRMIFVVECLNCFETEIIAWLAHLQAGR